MGAWHERTDDRPGRARSVDEFALLPEATAAFVFFRHAESLPGRRVP
jgi:hypothetical protein